MAITPLLFLASCSELQGVAVGKSSESTGIEMHFARCSAASPVKEARLALLGGDGLANTDDDPVLWQVRASSGQALDSIVVGVVPPGFEETVPLRAIPEGSELYVGASPKLGGERFRIDDLHPDVVFWSGQHHSVNDFRRQARDRGQCNSRSESFWKAMAIFGVIGLLFLVVPGALATALVFLVRWRRRSRTPPLED